jgi:hypothetical protein
MFRLNLEIHNFGRVYYISKMIFWDVKPLK